MGNQLPVGGTFRIAQISLTNTQVSASSLLSGFTDYPPGKGFRDVVQMTLCDGTQDISYTHRGGAISRTLTAGNEKVFPFGNTPAEVDLFTASTATATLEMLFA